MTVLPLLWLACTPDASPEADRAVDDGPVPVDQMSAEVTERTWALSDDVLAALTEGATAGEVEAWLTDEPDVVGFSGEDDDGSLFFRVADGAWAGVIGPDAGRPGDGSTAIASPKVVQVGIEPKTALVLSPHALDFGARDDAPLARSALEAIPDYRGRVEAVFDEAVTTDHLASVGDHGLVHLSTHGAVLCDAAGTSCATVVALAGDPTAPDANTVMTLPNGQRAPGYHLEEQLAWSGGLEDLVFFASACSSAKKTDAADLVAAAGGTYLGWTRDVSAAGAKRVSARFYEETLERGRTVNEAVATLRADNLIPDVWQRGGKTISADLAVFGGDVHLREVVELRDQGDRMEDGDRLRWVGEAGDGVSDVLVAEVFVYGVEPGREDEWEVSFRLDGRDARGKLRPTRDGAPTDDPAIWRLSGEVELGFDLDDEAEKVTLEARIPGKDSAHEVEAEVAGPRLELVSELTVIAKGQVSRQTVRGEAALVEGAHGFEGSGSLTFESYMPVGIAPPGQCSTTWTTFDGGLDVSELVVPGGDLDDGEPPTRLVWWPYDLYAEVTTTCGPRSFTLDDRFWFAGLLSAMYETGQYEEGAGFAMAPGTPGVDPGVAASWQVDFDYVDQGAIFEVATTLTLHTR